mgnify:CR=1 FL=1
MIKNLLLIFIVLFFTACSYSFLYNFNLSTKELKLKIDDENTITKN